MNLIRQPNIELLHFFLNTSRDLVILTFDL